jgi:hypothetical protein
MGIFSIVGKGCAVICGALASIAALEGVLTAYCLVMMQISQSPEPPWNCGVLIHGFEFLIACVVASVSFLASVWLVKDDKQILRAGRLGIIAVVIFAAGMLCWRYLNA